MEQTTVMKLDRNQSKPVFRLQSEEILLTCMLDTGADIPVWCAGLETLKLLYPNSYKSDGIFLLGGFGKGITKVDMYVIPEFTIGTLTFKNLNIAVLDKRRFSWDVILSYTMFTKMDYFILNRNQDTPLLQIVFDKECYYTGIHHHVKERHYVDKLYVFTSEDER